jgi:hypothetical protein
VCKKIHFHQQPNCCHLQNPKVYENTVMSHKTIEQIVSNVTPKKEIHNSFKGEKAINTTPSSCIFHSPLKTNKSSFPRVSNPTWKIVSFHGSDKLGLVKITLHILFFRVKASMDTNFITIVGAKLVVGYHGFCFC